MLRKMLKKGEMGCEYEICVARMIKKVVNKRKGL